METYRRKDRIMFTRRGKKRIGIVMAKWARGEGDGYLVLLDGDYVDVRTSTIIGKV